MSIDLLNRWRHFHDWYLDSIKVGPETIALGLYKQEERATLTFGGVTCVVLEGLGLLNIVFSIETLTPGNANYDRVRALLENGERLTDRTGNCTAFLYSTLGAELAIEFDSLAVERVS
ncbi:MULTISPECIES: hypothetical protein [unclassified Caballeronia]|uniref:hypothetical protein n=1 Tax=unclassified Caballeronia TaxID=2646786 RepID=UPI0028655AEB|nr:MULTISPECIES: hypothetical protein [unclassified Caballeronia]MDR5736515.1 hypothetical protein [Caballeronia sp. LZ016]MDR5811006.1 hypothetical protein [Caballeronia sp. LZ019]